MRIIGQIFAKRVRDGQIAGNDEATANSLLAETAGEHDLRQPLPNP